MRALEPPRPHGLAATTRALAAAAAALLVVTGCGAPDDGGDGDQVRVGLVAEPASLDFTSNDGAAIPQAMLSNVYEGLVELDEEGEVRPLLAEDYERSEDGRTYTFRLREGVRFSDGAEFTAEDAVFSIERVKEEWTIGLADRMDVVQEATATDAHTLEVRLEHPSNGWLYAMASRIGAMFSRTGVDDLATDPVGTGPYTLDTWERGDRLTLQRNPDYWGEAPQVPTVVFRYFQDPGAMNRTMLAGGLDAIPNLQEPEELGGFTPDGGFRVAEGTTHGEVVLAMNNDEPPLDDVRVRRAVRHAIDREALLETAWGGHGTLIGSMVPPLDPWYEDLTGVHPYDPDRARGLVEEAGAGGETLRLRVPNLPYAVNSAQVVQSEVEKTGMDVEIESLEFPARWLEEVHGAGDYDMSIIAHVEPRDLHLFADPDYYFHYGGEEFASLLEEADRGSPEEQVAKTREAARVLSEDAAADWLFLMPNLTVAREGLAGLPRDQVGEAFTAKTLRWEEEG
ncbi:ABC transporter substrate-binding protein [Nocardiopsis suaedae]|uniref:ABC transporter substrate-binding protein n=1 Tax=Nocardiopsis suaedae TaxID=3018444 RepID=A0ABT4TQ80_9ACTN|nr:ABC transporter substrate-binding protein [Nocardiopsis suaedae]MDA2806844.1 ABC transporter substrate-binding protein [Nocardiopsis suaedae]